MGARPARSSRRGGSGRKMLGASKNSYACVCVASEGLAQAMSDTWVECKDTRHWVGSSLGGVWFKSDFAFTPSPPPQGDSASAAKNGGRSGGGGPAGPRASTPTGAGGGGSGRPAGRYAPPALQRNRPPRRAGGRVGRAGAPQGAPGGAGPGRGPPGGLGVEAAMQQEARSKKQEASSKRQAASSKQQAASSKQQATSSKQQAV